MGGRCGLLVLFWEELVDVVALKRKRYRQPTTFAASQYWPSNLSVVTSLAAASVEVIVAPLEVNAPFYLFYAYSKQHQLSIPRAASPLAVRRNTGRQPRLMACDLCLLCVPTSCCCLLLTGCSLHRQHGHILREGYI